MATDPDAALHGAKPGLYKPGGSVLTKDGTLADTVEALPDLKPIRPTAAPIEDPASLTDVFSASKRVTRSDRTDFDEIMIRDGYAPIVTALGLPASENPAAFYQPDPGTAAKVGSMAQPSRLATAAKQGESSIVGNQYYASRDLQEQLIATEIKRRRATDKNFLPGVPDNVAGLRQYFLAAEKAKKGAAEATLAKSPGGVLGFGAQLAGGAVETFHDPINLITLPIGGGGKTILGVAAREALVNGMLELAQQPMVAHNRAELGEDYTAADAATNVGYAAAGGAILGTGIHVAGSGAKAASRFVGNVDLANSRAYKIFAALPQRLKDKYGAGIVPKWGKRISQGDTLGDVFGELDNSELTNVSRQVVGISNHTPEETAAVNVLERSTDVAQASPFQPGPVGDGMHEQGLAQALKDIEDGAATRPPETDLNGAASAPPGATPGEATPAAEPGRPRGASTASRPQPVGDAALDQFKAKLRHGVESVTDHDKNPLSSASGRFQFTDDTFADYYRKVVDSHASDAAALQHKNDPAMQERLMDALTRDNAANLRSIGEAVNEGNLYLEHFLGRGDAPKVFRANADTPIERILSADVLERNKFLKGKSASQVIAWAHAKMGAAVPSVSARPGFASTLDAASDDATIAQLRSEAMQLDDSVIGATRRLDGSPVNLYSSQVDAGRILVDANRFQFKAGGDAHGVTDRLKGVQEWDPALAGRVMLWEDKAGKVFVADGHQRVGLAKRIGADTPVDAMIFREADGVSAEEARTLAALKNVAEGTGTAIDAAKVVRGADMDALLKRLPPKSALVRDAGALARLSDDAFGAVYNGVIPPDIAAVVGHLLPNNPEQHGAMIGLLAKTDPATRGQAESIVRQGIAAGFHHEVQDELFGAREVASSLMLERAKVLEKGLAELKKMRLVHKTAAENKGTLERAGSTIAAEQSAREAQANAAAVEIVNRLAFRSGPVADALNAGARELASGGKLASLARQFADRVRQLDLAELDRGGGDGLDGSGRLGGAGEAEPPVREEPADQEQPSLLELEAATERFSDPEGKGVQQQAESLVHDLKADIAAKAAPTQLDDFAKAPEIQAAADVADQALSGKAAEAIDKFVGHGPMSRDKEGVDATGIMTSRQLETAIAENGEVAAEIEQAFAPVRTLIEEKYGPTVKLYRAQQAVDWDPNVHYGSRPDTRERAVLSWTSDPKFADHHVGVDPRRDRPDIPEEKIAQLEQEFEAQGEITVRKGVMLKREADGSIGIYDDAVGGFVTDTDSVRSYYADQNRYRAEDRDRNAKKREKIVTADVPLSEVVWVTDRAGQSEFIVRNKKGSPWFIDEHGKQAVLHGDSNPETDPAIADRQRQELVLKAASPLRSTAEQDGTMGLELFNRDQFGLELDDEAKSLLDELDADDKAIKAMKDCL